MTINILFVCLGNICRSPMAEAIFSQMVNEVGLSDKIRVDSAGTGSWHVGEPARHGYSYNGRARQVNAADMSDPDGMIIAMSAENLRDLRYRYGDHPRLYRLLEFAENSREKDVPDPYYEGNFDTVYQLVLDGCRGLLKSIQQEQET
jgi:protein-tyrosine phosphatase